MGCEQRPVRTQAVLLKLWAQVCGATIAIFLCAMNVCAQVPSWPYDSDFGKGYHVVEPQYTYKGSFASIRKIDFRNLTVRLFDEHGRPDETVALKNGKCEKKTRVTYDSYELVAVYHLKGEKDGIERMVLLLDEFYIGGSSSNGTFAQVLERSDGRLTVTQQIEYDRDALRRERHHSFHPTNEKLEIRASHYMPGDAHCCISAIDVVTFRWTGEKFVRQSVKTELSEYGKKKAEEAKAKKKP